MCLHWPLWCVVSSNFLPSGFSSKFISCQHSFVLWCGVMNCCVLLPQQEVSFSFALSLPVEDEDAWNNICVGKQKSGFWLEETYWQLLDGLWNCQPQIVLIILGILNFQQQENCWWRLLNQVYHFHLIRATIRQSIFIHCFIYRFTDHQRINYFSIIGLSNL